MSSVRERTRVAFERLAEESQRATERVLERANGLVERTSVGSAARARLERTRLERTLFNRLAELGNRVYRRSREAAPGDLLEDPGVKSLVDQIRTLDRDLRRLGGTGRG